MPILSAVFALTDHTSCREETLAALAAEPQITLGVVSGHRLPVVLESRDRDADKALWRWATGLPGVLVAELVFADFSDLQEPCDAESTS